MSTRIVLVDDHQVLREGLRSLLEKQPDTQVVGEASNGRAALQLIRELKPDLVIMDVNMPGMDGIDATRQITLDSPAVKVIALSMYLRRTFVSEMFKSGAAGYLLKENTFAEIMQAIRTVLAGERYACSKVTSLLVGEYIGPEAQVLAGKSLTERELLIVRMLADGKSTKEVALALDASTKTIDACRRQIMQKLGLGGLAELVKYAIREGLTTADA